MDQKKLKQLSKWVIFVTSICIMIYLFLENVYHIAASIWWLMDKVKPLLMGMILALMLDVPMSLIESRLFKKEFRGKRQSALVLSLVLTLGIVILLAVLVIPELIEAVQLLVSIISDTLDQLANANEHSGQQELWIEMLAQFDIDWVQLKTNLIQWLDSQRGTWMTLALDFMKSVTDNLVSFFIGLIFSIYLLSRKEIYLSQGHRLLRAWLPDRISLSILHILDVFSNSFSQFLAGQVMEAVILGSLCAAGMLILRIPYAPMIGALIGVTALIPYLGAMIGMAIGSIMICAVHPFKAIVFIIFLFALQQVEGNMIYPKVVGAKINIPAIWVFIGVTLGGNFAGPLGMFFGVPIVSSLVFLLKEATVNKERRSKAGGVQ